MSNKGNPMDATINELPPINNNYNYHMWNEIIPTKYFMKTYVQRPIYIY